MLKEINEKEQEIAREQHQRSQMQLKIKEMESKLITGGKDILIYTDEQEQQLKHKR